MLEDVAHQVGSIFRHAHGAGGGGAYFRGFVQLNFFLEAGQRVQGPGVGLGRDDALADATLAQTHAHFGAQQHQRLIAGHNGHLHNEQVEGIGAHIDEGEAAGVGMHELG